MTTQVLRYNNSRTTLATGLTNSATTIDLVGPLTEGGSNVPTLAGGGIILLGIEDEVVALTAYTAGATTGTISRGYGDTAAVAHDAGTVVANVVTKSDVVGAGPSAWRFNDAGSPVSLSANIETAITEAFLDDEDHADTGIAWENGNDGYRLDHAGLYEVGAYLDVDSSGLSAGHVFLRLDGFALPIGTYTSPMRYGSGIDASLYVFRTGWCEAGALVKLWIRSSQAVDVVYGELAVQRLSPS